MEEEGIIDEQPDSGNSRPTSSTSAISERPIQDQEHTRARD